MGSRHRGPPALIVAAHGSRADPWVASLRSFADHVRQSAGVDAVFGEVDVAFLEIAEPRLAPRVERALADGAGRVLVAPLFLTASTHLAEDVPGVLGLDVAEHVRRRLVGEGHACLPPGLPVTLLELGPVSDLLQANVERRLSLTADRSSEEAVVLCAYGSPVHHEAWEALLSDVRSGLMASGFGYAGQAYVGHSHATDRVAAVAEAIVGAGRMAGIRRVHVVPLLMAVGELQIDPIGVAVDRVGAATPDFRVAYEVDAILPDGDLAARVGRVALRALGIYPAVDRGAQA